MEEIATLIRPDGEAANCVSCDAEKVTGRYAGLPCCGGCYQNGLLREWLAERNALDWPDIQTS